jgi:hypothetical protein
MMVPRRKFLRMAAGAATLKLNGAIVESLADANVRARHKAEIEKWWPIIKAAAIKPE